MKVTSAQKSNVIREIEHEFFKTQTSKLTNEATLLRWIHDNKRNGAKVCDIEKNDMAELQRGIKNQEKALTKLRSELKYWNAIKVGKR